MECNQTSLLDDEPDVSPPPKPQLTGEQLKEIGKARAVVGREALLARAREIAFDIARGLLPHADGQVAANGLCHADDVYAQWQRDNEELVRQRRKPVEWLGNTAGSMFSGNRQVWETAGYQVKSQRPHAHANKLEVWKLKNKVQE